MKYGFLLTAKTADGQYAGTLLNMPGQETNYSGRSATGQCYITHGTGEWTGGR